MMVSPTTPKSAEPEPADRPAPPLESQSAPPEPPEPSEPTSAAPPSSPEAPRGLWRHGDFLKLWSGQSLSLFGTQVTVVAMPLVAVQLLDATSTQMGILGALARAPFALFLFAGVWADRVRRRPTMIATDLGRGLVIGLIPVLFFLDSLQMAWLYAIVLVAGTLGVFFEVANQAFIPSLLDPDLVPEGNAKFQVSQSVAQVAGPSVAGLLIAFLSAATVIIVDAVSYFVGALASFLIRKPEPRPGGDSKPPKLFTAIGEGIRWVWKQPVVRPMMLATAFYMTFTSGIQALYVFYLDRVLNLSASWIGFTLAFLGVGAIIGSLFSLKALRAFGPGPTAFWATVAGNGAFLLVPLAGGPLWLVIGLLAFAQVLVGFTGPIAQVSMGSLRMRITPNNMQGRVVATFRGLSLGLAPVGALVAGVIAQSVGLRPMLFVFAVGALVPIVIMALSPIPGTRTFPAAADSGA
jgi:MFS family permease